MSIINKLTLRHIMSHKKRSLLTVLSIAVSVAMVTAVFTTVFSFLIFFKDATAAYDGNWHARFSYEEMPDLNAFEKDGVEYYVSADVFQLTYDKDIKKGKAYAQIEAADKGAEKMRNINITEGAFPEKEDEILLTKEYVEKNKLSWKVGDTVNVYCIDSKTQREHYEAFTICGFAEDNVSFFDRCDGIIACAGGILEKDIPVSVTVSYHPLDKTIYEESKALKTETGAESLIFNSDLLSFSGVAKESASIKAIEIMTAIILIIIVIASVIMIFDSFAVSYQERERYLGMLASVGATKRQKRASIYFEGFVLGAAAVPLGIIAGLIGMAITFKSIQGAFLTSVSIPIQDTLKVHFSPYIFFGTILLTALTIFISCYIPARRASKTTPIAAIKGTNTVTVKKAKHLRVSKLTKKLYGYEGELAVKNFRRNGRRSRNIVFALALSVVLFMSVTNFSQMFTFVVQRETGEQNADFTVYVKQKDRDVVRDYFETADIDDCVGNNYYFGTLENTELFTEDARRIFNTAESNDKRNLFIYIMDNADFDEYLKSLDENPALYHAKDTVKALVFNRVNDTTGVLPKGKTANAFSDSVTGKVFNCSVKEYNEDTDKNDILLKFSMTAGAVTEKEYGGRLFMPKYVDYPSLIVPEDALSVLPLEKSGYYFSIFARDYKPVMQEADEYFEIKGINCEIVDSSSQMQSVNAILTVMKVFIYGFISLITLIAVINIINSISNSMNERKTEFAMLKSVGVTPKGFKKMIYVESVRYGVKSLLRSIPVSAALHFLMYVALSKAEGMDIGFSLNLGYYIASIIAVFVIITVSLLYSADKIKDDNIIENLKQD